MSLYGIRFSSGFPLTWRFDKTYVERNIRLGVFVCVSVYIYMYIYIYICIFVGLM